MDGAECDSTTLQNIGGRRWRWRRREIVKIVCYEGLMVCDLKKGGGGDSTHCCP